VLAKLFALPDEFHFCCEAPGVETAVAVYAAGALNLGLLKISGCSIALPVLTRYRPLVLAVDN